MTSVDEINVISHEIDKQMTKKTLETLQLLKEVVSGALEKNVFLKKMSDASDTSQTDLLSIAKKLIKRHKFELNPNHKEFMRIKFLHFPTSSKDLSELEGLIRDLRHIGGHLKFSKISYHLICLSLYLSSGDKIR